MAPVSRRSVLRGLLATSVGSAAASAVSGCGALTGFATTGGSGMTFFSTQFTPVEEAERFRGVLREAVDGDVSYVTSDPGPFVPQIRTQVDAGSVRTSLLGGLHGELAPLADGYLTDLTDLLDGLGDLGWPAEFLELAKLGTSRTWYVLGVRAESLRVVGADEPGALTCTVEVFEPLGSSVLLTTDVSGQRVKVSAPPDFRAAPGDELRVTPTQTRWYDPETQLLLEVR